MKRCWMLVFALALTLWGCGGTGDFEQVQDVYQPQAAVAAQVALTLPEEAAQTVMNGGENGTLYFCDGYTLTVQTLDGGDLNRTMQTMTGYALDSLAVMETAFEDCKRYECVWSSAGEGGDQVGRLLCLDDGSYHYVVTVMAQAESAGDLRQVWEDLFSSVSLGYTGS